MGSGLVEEEAAAYLDVLILSQLHLVEELQRELGGLFLIHLPPKTRALEKGNGYHVVVKLSCFLPVCSDYDSVEEVANSGVVDLDRQRCKTSCVSTRT